MNTKKEVMLCGCSWDEFLNIVKKPELVLHLFPYCKDCNLKSDKVYVEFDVKKFLFNFKFNFDLKVDIGYPYVKYIFVGKRGTLIISFKLDEKVSELDIEVSWSGFGEKLMDRQMEEFAKGIKKSLEYIRDQYVNTEYLVKSKTSNSAKVENLTPLKMPSILKYFYATTDSRSFVILGAGESGDFFRTIIKDGVVEKCVYIKGKNRSELKINKRIIDIEWTDFKNMKPKGNYYLKIEEKS